MTPAEFLDEKKAGEREIEAAVHAEWGIGFDLIRGVCNGTKHVQTDGSHIVVFRAGDDTERPPAVWGEAIWDVSRWDDVHGGREVNHGSERLDVSECARAVVIAFKKLDPQQLGGCDLAEF